MRDELTLRETEVLQLAAMGRQMKEVARELGISLDTVKERHMHLRARLGARNIAHAVFIAVSRGYIKVESE